MSGPEVGSQNSFSMVGFRNQIWIRLNKVGGGCERLGDISRGLMSSVIK